MGSKIRTYEPGKVYSITIKTVDDQFLFKPDHDRKHPLLAKGCPLESFERFNENIPNPSVINIIGACVARGIELGKIRIHWIECNSNHLLCAAAHKLCYAQHPVMWS